MRRFRPGEADDVGHLIRLLGLRQGRSDIAKLTLGPDSSFVGQRICDVALSENALLAAVVRAGRVITAVAEETLADGDELVFIAPRDGRD